MYVPYSSLPANASVWIYQADRPLTNAEQAIIYSELKAFTDQWTVHGQPMEASMEIRYNQFIILAANDQASGCSIDSSVRAIKHLGEQTGVDFFNRQLVCFKKDEAIFSLPIHQLKAAFANGTWDASVYMFNNLVNTKAAVEVNWLVMAGNSWLKRYLTQPHVA